MSNWTRPTEISGGNEGTVAEAEREAEAEAKAEAEEEAMAVAEAASAQRWKSRGVAAVVAAAGIMVNENLWGGKRGCCTRLGLRLGLG